MTKIILLNGKPRVGKDTFVDLAKEREKLTVVNYSTVDKVKEAALLLGWDNVKDDTGRKFLSDLKDMSSLHYDGPFLAIKNKVKDLDLVSHKQDIVIFIHTREPPEIARIKEYYAGRCWTVVLERDQELTGVENLSCHADQNVDQYEYDFRIPNNGTLEDLRGEMDKLLDHILQTQAEN